MKVIAEYRLEEHGIVDGYCECVILTYKTKSRLLGLSKRNKIILYRHPNLSCNLAVSLREIKDDIGRFSDMNEYIRNFINKHIKYVNDLSDDNSFIESVNGLKFEFDISLSDLSKLKAN